MNVIQMREIMALVDVPGFEFKVHEADSIYLQGHHTAPDITSGVSEPQSTRKWLLSWHMTKSEIVQTAFKCYITSLEHQARESFRYRDKRIFGPHYDCDALHEICRDDHLDYRRTNGNAASG